MSGVSSFVTRFLLKVAFQFCPEVNTCCKMFFFCLLIPSVRPYIHTIHYITLHIITLHYITLQYSTLYYINIHTYIHTCRHKYTLLFSPSAFFVLKDHPKFGFQGQPKHHVVQALKSVSSNFGDSWSLAFLPHPMIMFFN